MNQWFDLLFQLWQGRKTQHLLDQLELSGNQRLVSQADESFSNKQYFVFFEGDFFEADHKSEALSERTAATLSEAGIEAQPTQFYDAINGFTIELTPSEAEELRQSQGIGSVEADRPMPMTPPVEIKPEPQPRISPTKLSGTNNQRTPSSFSSNSSENISLDQFWIGEQVQQIEQPFSSENTGSINALPVYNNGTASTGETLPYGVKAVWEGQDISSQGNVGDGTYAFVIDSGVLNTTGDLNLNTTWSKSWINGESAFTDGNGHGTHVAGTIAALANGIGVVGVAPGAEVISLKLIRAC